MTRTLRFRNRALVICVGPIHTAPARVMRTRGGGASMLACFPCPRVSFIVIRRGV